MITYFEQMAFTLYPDISEKIKIMYVQLCWNLIWLIFKKCFFSCTHYFKKEKSG